MCGLGAIIIKENKDKDKYKTKLLNMSNLISHRGPDQAGFLEYENILLSHLRLPVMDPRNLGRQPMSVDSRYSIIFNGEIFNYKQIKKTGVFFKRYYIPSVPHALNIIPIDACFLLGVMDA